MSQNHSWTQLSQWHARVNLENNDSISTSSPPFCCHIHLDTKLLYDLREKAHNIITATYWRQKLKILIQRFWNLILSEMTPIYIKTSSVTFTIFLTSKFSYFFFAPPTHKTETETANRWETTNSQPLAPLIMIGQSETRSNSQILFITLFSAAQLCCTFHQPQQANGANMVGAKTISLS
jgi:hypothetical protein